MAQVILKNVSKLFPGRPAPSLEGFGMSVEVGAMAVLAGPPGCGKSLVLRLIAGLDQPTGGEIWIDGRLVNDVTPKDRQTAMVFQNDALYPHLTIYRNLAFGLHMRKLPRPEVDRRVRLAARTLGISELLDRPPKGLSEEQISLTRLGRAMARQPRVLLIDEPFGARDPRARRAMVDAIVRLRQAPPAEGEPAMTIICATGDAEAASELGAARVFEMPAPSAAALA
jgi:multiple sugar transport system ATP-binding protein